MLKKKGQGRPKKDPHHVRNKVLSMRLNDEELDRIKENAKLKGLSVADYFISLMNQSERKDEYWEHDIW